MQGANPRSGNALLDGSGQISSSNEQVNENWERVPDFACSKAVISSFRVSSRLMTSTCTTKTRHNINGVQSYFELLPFAPVEITCLALPEILAENIRACYQRNQSRDIFDLGRYATRPLEQDRIRRLAGVEGATACCSRFGRDRRTKHFPMSARVDKR